MKTIVVQSILALTTATMAYVAYKYPFKKVDGQTGEFADIDHLISLQSDHLFRAKLTT
jgi:hypothetical protein